MPVNLDTAILVELNSIAVSSPDLSEFQLFLSENNLIKGGLFMVAIWWLWFRQDKAQDQNHNHNRLVVIGILVGCLVGTFATRVLTHLLPFRPRPIYAADLHLSPFLWQPVGLDHMTSLPSDHATLYFALATGFFFISRRFGFIALLYALLMICFPRLFLGYHYPTDLIAGGIIGTIAACVANLPFVRQLFYQPIINWQQRHPSSFYSAMFLMTYQINSLFSGIRALLTYLIGSGA